VYDLSTSSAAHGPRLQRATSLCRALADIGVPGYHSAAPGCARAEREMVRVLLSSTSSHRDRAHSAQTFLFAARRGERVGPVARGPSCRRHSAGPSIGVPARAPRRRRAGTSRFESGSHRRGTRLGRRRAATPCPSSFRCRSRMSSTERVALAFASRVMRSRYRRRASLHARLILPNGHRLAGQGRAAASGSAARRNIRARRMSPCGRRPRIRVEFRPMYAPWPHADVDLGGSTA